MGSPIQTLIVIAGAIVVAPVGTLAQAPSDALPPRLQAIIAADVSTCREQGGQAEIAASHVQPGDFDGDARTDYLIDQNGMTCPTAASLYCGDRPCPVYALLAVDGFGEPRHIPGDVFEPRVRPQGAVSVVETAGVDAAGRPTRLRWMWRGGAWRPALIRRE